MKHALLQGNLSVHAKSRGCVAGARMFNMMCASVAPRSVTMPGGALVSVFSHALAKRAAVASHLTLEKQLEYQNAPLGHYHGKPPPELSLYHSIIQGGGVRFPSKFFDMWL